MKISTVWCGLGLLLSTLACESDVERLEEPFDGRGSRAQQGTDGSSPSGGGDDGGRSSGSAAAAGVGPEAGLLPSPRDAGSAAAVVMPGPPGDSGGPDCWQLPVIDRARIMAAPGEAERLVGGKIVGSNTSPMNDFVDLAVVTSAPAEGEWLDVGFTNETAYRYVKYYAPPGSYGIVADLEFYTGDVELEGEPFGTAGSFESEGTTFDLALDGNPATFFRGPLPNDAYVGLDLAAGHVTLPPTFAPPAGQYAAAPLVTLEAEPGAAIFYTLDGTDPAIAGIPYTAPIQVPSSATLLRAVAFRDCALGSETVSAAYQVRSGAPSTGRPSGVASSMHIGNSLTDTIVDHLAPLAQSGGVLLDFNRYTIPGAGTWLYADSPTGGFGVDNVQQTLRSRPFDHLSMQPYTNLPCQIVASGDGSDSDSGYIDRAWDDARTQNPDVQLWIYQQWPEPDNFSNCLSGGGWLRSDWQPPAPADWDAAVMNELAYHEALVAELARLNPDAPRPYIVPGGLALLRLKQAIEAGRVPGFSNFFSQIFLGDGTDVHLARPGQYFITLVFYASMFQSDPAGTANDPSYGVTDAQAAAMQAIVWETVTTYPSSGVPR